MTDTCEAKWSLLEKSTLIQDAKNPGVCCVCLPPGPPRAFSVGTPCLPPGPILCLCPSISSPPCWSHFLAACNSYFWEAASCVATTIVAHEALHSGKCTLVFGTSGQPSRSVLSMWLETMSLLSVSFLDQDRVGIPVNCSTLIQDAESPGASEFVFLIVVCRQNVGDSRTPVLSRE